MLCDMSHVPLQRAPPWGQLNNEEMGLTKVKGRFQHLLPMSTPFAKLEFLVWNMKMISYSFQGWPAEVVR